MASSSRTKSVKPLLMRVLMTIRHPGHTLHMLIYPITCKVTTMTTYNQACEQLSKLLFSTQNLIPPQRHVPFTPGVVTRADVGRASCHHTSQCLQSSASITSPKSVSQWTVCVHCNNLGADEKKSMMTRNTIQKQTQTRSAESIVEPVNYGSD